ncbi:MAG: ParB/RepB/Spo0J family partition protein [Eubacteriales bacterium]|nr:ParB/RepB/Spo0J family partition protein [Eubacteriales bacterium]MDD4389409.1 ParB/RepB/Spo0J family partition protein [Eubacteriales bacterium]
MWTKKTTELSIDLICTNPKQPRTIFREEELIELRDSIIEYGVLQPVIVKKDKYGLYILIAGERRLRASKMAGLKKIPVIVRADDEKDAAIIALVENVQRENLSYIEEACAYKNLMEEHNLTQNEIAKCVGKQQSTISNKIRLLALPPDIREQLANNKLTERHARAILKIDDEDIRKKVLDRIIAYGLNVRQSEKLIQDIIDKEQEETRKANKICFINYKIYLNSIKKAFSAISEVEKNAKYYQEDKGEYVEVLITIPKKRQAASRFSYR